MATMFSQLASTEHRQLLALHHGNSKGCVATWSHHRTIGCLSEQKLLQKHCYNVLKICVNGASTTFSLASLKMLRLCGVIHPPLNYRSPLQTNRCLTASSLCPKIECQQSVNDFRHWILECLPAMRLHWFTIERLAAFLGKNTYHKIISISENEHPQSVKGGSTERQWLLILNLA
jgi:hypothetical protein